MTPTVTSSSSTSHFHSPCLLIKKKILCSPNEQLLPALLAIFSLASSKKYRSRKTRRHLVHRYDRFHTHTQMQYKLITLSLRSRDRLFLPLRLSPFLCWQLHYTKMPTPKLNFRARSGTRFLTKSSLPYDVSPPSIHPIVPAPSTLYAGLGPSLPPSMCHATLTPQTKLEF